MLGKMNTKNALNIFEVNLQSKSMLLLLQVKRLCFEVWRTTALAQIPHVADAILHASTKGFTQ